MSTTLSTDFQDDILASSNTKRKYSMTYNTDGTVSFEDITVYSQTGSAYGAKEINEERKAINENSEALGSLIYMQTFQRSVQLAANGRTDFGIPITVKEGYTPIAVAYVDYSGSVSQIAIGKYSVFTDQCYISLQNLGSQQTVTVSARILFARTDCVLQG